MVQEPLLSKSSSMKTTQIALFGLTIWFAAVSSAPLHGGHVALRSTSDWRDDNQPIPAEVDPEVEKIMETLMALEPWDHL